MPVLLLWLLLPRLLLLPPRRLVVLVVLLLQLLLPLLLLHVMGGELVAGELVEDRAAAGVLVSGCCRYCYCFCSGCCQCRGGGWWWWCLCYCNCYWGCYYYSLSGGNSLQGNLSRTESPRGTRRWLLLLRLLLQRVLPMRRRGLLVVVPLLQLLPLLFVEGNSSQGIFSRTELP